MLDLMDNLDDADIVHLQQRIVSHQSPGVHHKAFAVENVRQFLRPYMMTDTTCKAFMRWVDGRPQGTNLDLNADITKGHYRWQCAVVQQIRRNI